MNNESQHCQCALCQFGRRLRDITHRYRFRLSKEDKSFLENEVFLMAEQSLMQEEEIERLEAEIKKLKEVEE